MVQKALLGEEKIERTVRAVTNDSSTVLDFMAAFKRKYPVDWGKLVERFGQFGSKIDRSIKKGISFPPSVLSALEAWAEEKCS